MTIYDKIIQDWLEANLRIEEAKIEAINQSHQIDNGGGAIILASVAAIQEINKMLENFVVRGNFLKDEQI
jgi:hypothetical protein